MKRKSKRCSTGHGTGVTPPVDLRRLLAKGHPSMFLGRVDLGALGSVERPVRRFRWHRKPAEGTK